MFMRMARYKLYKNGKWWLKHFPMQDLHLFENFNVFPTYSCRVCLVSGTNIQVPVASMQPSIWCWRFQKPTLQVGRMEEKRSKKKNKKKINGEKKHRKIIRLNEQRFYFHTFHHQRCEKMCESLWKKAYKFNIIIIHSHAVQIDITFAFTDAHTIFVYSYMNGRWNCDAFTILLRNGMDSIAFNIQTFHFICVAFEEERARKSMNEWKRTREIWTKKCEMALTVSPLEKCGGPFIHFVIFNKETSQFFCFCFAASIAIAAGSYVSRRAIVALIT